MAVAITKTGDAITLSSQFTNPLYDIKGFIIGFDYASVTYRYYRRTDFREEHQYLDYLNGYFTEDLYLEYIQYNKADLFTNSSAVDPKEFKTDNFSFEPHLAAIGDTVVIEILHFEPPTYNFYFKEITYTFQVEASEYDAKRPKDYLKFIGSRREIDLPQSAIDTAQVVNSDFNSGPTGRFYAKNFSDRVAGWGLTDNDLEKKIARRVTLTCFRIYWTERRILRNLMDATAYANLSTIAASPTWETQVESLPLIQKLIFGLLKSWGYFHANEFEPFEAVLPDIGVYEPYKEYGTAVLNFYNSTYKRQDIIEGTDDNEKVRLLIKVLPEIAISAIPLEVRVLTLMDFAKDRVPNSEELLVLKIVRSVAFADSDNFLKLLMDKTIESGSESVPLFQALYDKVEDKILGFGTDNRKALMKSLYILWYLSDFNPNQKFDFANETENTTDLFNSYGQAPLILNYDSGKFFGFYVDNMNFFFSGNKIKIKEEVTEVVDVTPNFGNDFQTSRVETRYKTVGTYDYYQPVSLNDYKEGDFAIKVPQIALEEQDDNSKSALLPLFFLKYIDDYGDSEDLWTGIGIAFDVALTFTGIGNLAKLRHLRHVTKLGRLRFFGQGALPAAERILALEALTGVAGLIELTASVASLVLQYYTDGCKVYMGGPDSGDPTPGVLDVINDANESAAIPEQPSNPDYQFCKNLDQWLFWVQLASVGTDIVSSLMVRRASKKLLQDGVPLDFPDDALDIITRYSDDADAFLLQLKLKRRVAIFERIKPSMVNRIKESNGAFAKRYFNDTFGDSQLETIIDECLDLGFRDPKFVEDVILMACRAKKRSNVAEVLIQLNYYKKVVLKNGFPSGFANINDYKLYCNKAKDYFDGLSEFSGRVEKYRVQGSILFKKSDFSPVDPDNIPFLKKRNPSPPPEYLNVPNVPDDLDVQILMTQRNAREFCDEIIKEYERLLDLHPNGSKTYLRIQSKLTNVKKGLNKGMIKADYLPDYMYNQYRVAIKNNGQDLFQQTSSAGTIDIGFAIIVKNSKYDVLPVMDFKL
ncbi:MAG: hypothetical protein AAF611_20570 [Bacteroidota bacterium]